MTGLQNIMQMDKAQKQFLKFNTFAGNEIVPGITRRLALMNLFPAQYWRYRQ